MATRNEMQPYDVATANFKLWTSFVRNLILTDGGWLLSTETGSTNPTTVGSAPAVGSYVWEVYKSNDGISPQIFVRVEYWNQGCPALGFILGTGSNGAGAITNAGYHWQIPGVGTGATVGGSYNCVGSADSGSFRFVQWRDYSGAANPSRVPCFFAVERQKDTSGVAIGNSFQVTVFGTDPDVNINGSVQNANAQCWRTQTYVNGVGWMRYEPSPLVAQTALSSFAQNGNGGGVPFLFAYGEVVGASLDLLCGKQADFPDGQIVTLTHFGASHTFFVVSLWSIVSTLGQLGSVQYMPIGTVSTVVSAANCLLMRYE